MDINKLTNIQRVIVLIRFDIKDSENIKLINILIKSLKNNNTNTQMIKEFESLNTSSKMQKKFDLWRLKQSKELSRELTQEEKNIIDTILIYSLSEVEELIKKALYEKANDIIDAIHGIPEVFIEDKRIRDLKKYWKIYIKPFQKKWKSAYFNEIKILFKVYDKNNKL